MRNIIGIICPKFGHVKLDECINCKVKYTFTCYPPPLLFYLYDEIEKEKTAKYDFSCTELIDCPRKVSIVKKHGVYINPDKVYQAWKGLIGHNVMERWVKERPGFETYIEHRFYVKFHSDRLNKNYIISFKPDRIDKKLDNFKAVLYDFKFVKDLPSFNKPYGIHKKQVLLYATLLKDLNINVVKIYLIYMTFDNLMAIDVPVEMMSKYDIEEMIIKIDKRIPVLFIPEENWRCKYCEVLPQCMLELTKEGYDVKMGVKKWK